MLADDEIICDLELKECFLAEINAFARAEGLLSIELLRNIHLTFEVNY